MTQIATTIEQSRRLIEAGVNRKSADMRWIWLEEEKYFLVVSRWYPLHGGTAAWSLSALWQMVYELDKTYEFPTELSADELIETLVRTIIFRRENK